MNRFDLGATFPAEAIRTDPSGTRRASASRRAANALLALISLAYIVMVVPGAMPAAKAMSADRWDSEGQRVVADAIQHVGQTYGYSDGGWDKSGDTGGVPIHYEKEPPQLMAAPIDCVGLFYVVYTETGHGYWDGPQKLVDHRRTVGSLNAWLKDTYSGRSSNRWYEQDNEHDLTSTYDPVANGVQIGDAVIFQDYSETNYTHVAIFAGTRKDPSDPSSAYSAKGWYVEAAGWDTGVKEDKVGKIDDEGSEYRVAGVYHTGLQDDPPLSNTIPTAPLARAGSWPGSSVKAPPAVRSTYTPLSGAVQVLDTSEGIGLHSKVQANWPATFQVAGKDGIPANATAVTGTVTVFWETGGSALYLGPVPSATPSTTTISFKNGDTESAGMTVGLGSGGTLSVTYVAPWGNTADVSVNVTGYFRPGISDNTYRPVSTSRVASAALQGNVPVTFAVAGRGDIPADAVAVTGNATIVGPENADWGAIVGPTPSRTLPIALIRSTTGQSTSYGLTLALGPDGTLSATTTGDTTAFRFDVTGYYAPDISGETYIPLASTRLFDTIQGIGLVNNERPAPVSALASTEIKVTGTAGIPAEAAGVSGILTALNETSAGSASIVADPAQDTNSQLTFAKGDAKSNSLTATLSAAGTLCATYVPVPSVAATTDFLFDVTGYFMPPQYLPATYHPMTSTRVVDTRKGLGLHAALKGMTAYSFKVTGGTPGTAGYVPSDATAVTGNVTVTESTGGWALYLGPESTSSPPTSTINFAKGQTLSAGVTVGLGRQGYLSAIYLASVTSTTQMLFDVTGYFTEDGTGATYHQLDEPGRLMDTRKGIGLSGTLAVNTSYTFPVRDAPLHGVGTAILPSIPANATAVTANVTVVNETGPWALYVGPVADATPDTSTLNFLTGDVRSNSMTVALSPSGSLSVTYVGSSGNTTDVVLDITGYYTPDLSGAAYVPILPARLVDTRTPIGINGKLTANKPETFKVATKANIPASAIAISGIATAVKPSDGWALYVGPVALASPATSSLDFDAGDIVGNSVTVGLSPAGYLAVTYMGPKDNTDTTDFVFDATGYFVPAAHHMSVAGLSSPRVSATPGKITVRAIDASGQVATGYLGTIHFTSSDPAAVLPPDYQFNAGDEGSHTFEVALETAGKQSIEVADVDTGSIDGSQAGVVVTPGKLDHLVLSPDGATLEADGVQAYTAEALDAAGNSLGDDTANTIFTIDDPGTCNGALCGSSVADRYVVTGTDGTATGEAILHVVPIGLDHLVVSPTDATIAAGKSQEYTAEGFDADGNTLGDVTSATTFTVGKGSPCSAAVCSPTLPGDYTVKATDGLAVGTATLHVKVGPLNHLVLSPSSATVFMSRSQTYTAKGFDAENNLIGDVTSATTFTVRGGVCTSSSCTSSAAGSYVVTGTDGVASGTAALRVIGSTYHPITPVRLLDTRSGNGYDGKLLANTPVTFQITGRGGVPAGATAVTGILTAVSPTSSWAVYVGPDPIVKPSTSSLSFDTGETAGTGLTVRLSSAGKLSATYLASAGNTMDLVLDVTGYFTPDTTGTTYHPLTPVRLLDTRADNGLNAHLVANTPATFQITGRGNIPAGAKAVTGIVTVVSPTAAWAVYLGPDPVAKPSTSSLNFDADEIKGTGLTVQLSSSGALSATFISSARQTTDLVFDVTGYYTADMTGATYVPLPPVRLLDTRYGNGITGKLAANTPASFQITTRGDVPTGATAVSGILTVVSPSGGWAAYLGPDPIAQPLTSSLNFVSGQTTGSGLTVRLSSAGKLSVTYMGGGGKTTDMVFDVSGYYVPAW